MLHSVISKIDSRNNPFPFFLFNYQNLFPSLSCTMRPPVLDVMRSHTLTVDSSYPVYSRPSPLKGLYVRLALFIEIHYTLYRWGKQDSYFRPSVSPSSRHPVQPPVQNQVKQETNCELILGPVPVVFATTDAEVRLIVLSLTNATDKMKEWDEVGGEGGNNMLTK